MHCSRCYLSFHYHFHIMNTTIATAYIHKNIFSSAIFAGFILGIISLGIAFLMEKIQPAPPQLAGDMLFTKAPTWWIVIIATIWAPIFETLVAQVVPIFIAQKITDQKLLWIIFSAAAFSLGHFFSGGGFSQLILTFVYGLVFAAAFVICMPCGFLKATGAVFLLHSMNNALISTYSFLCASQ